jgi:thiol-disulfide isomerase/thioredoxin
MSESSEFTGPTPDAPRRRGLFLGVAALAALAGAGLAWWRVQPHGVTGGAQPPMAGTAGTRATADALDPAETQLWSLSLDTPSGEKLAMQSLRGKPLMINFWATWCPPCVEELPLLDGFYKENAANGWQIVGLALDQPSAVRNFLQKTPVSFPIVMGGLDGSELGRNLGNSVGGLPFTVVLGGAGKVVHRKMGKVSPDDLKAWRTLA